MDSTLIHTLLTIYDSFPVDGGTCLVGVNSDFDSLTSETIEQRIGPTVILRRSASVLGPFTVLGVDTMTSLENKKNIVLKVNGELPNGFLADVTEVCRAI